MLINLSLLARLHAICEAFNQEGFRYLPKDPIPKFNPPVLENEKTEDEGDGGGGGTIKGFRGKNDAYAKAVNAMRRLGRR